MSMGEWWYWNIVSKLKDASLSIGVGKEDCVRIIEAIENVALIPGDLVEIGVAEGGSAAVICEAKKEKTVHLFDTFAGLPELGEEDKGSAFSKGQYFAEYLRVKKFFKQYSNVYVYKGLFPKSGKSIENNKFSFVHLDVDIYKSTYESLEFLWPRMTTGGILISHDYQTEPGVKKAFDDYFKGSVAVETPGLSQCLMIKS